ncbi:hypothetical protein OVA07_05510 [Novosphingobium sp. SL115]|uniref:hypothetical protein n=1 Tax=Novosphingobium sp. SL115 TaxID=2995150 RepID=UPI0022759A6C|nr:hypothetical protein [Novosphingobium sp. SL115]MCY1670468.1 hypothetical protein [Novosphingobium sp. SL115]
MQRFRQTDPDSSTSQARAKSAESRRNADFARLGAERAASTALSMKWAALHEAADVVSTLAGAKAEQQRPEVRNFPAIMRDTGGLRYELAQQGVEDLAAVMEAGLAALLAVSTRGRSPAPAALALWQEFIAARTALLTLIPPLIPPAGDRRRP